MPKSRVRKNHKKKISERVDRYEQAKNRMKKLIDNAMMQMQIDKLKELGLETKADTNLLDLMDKKEKDENLVTE